MITIEKLTMLTGAFDYLKNYGEYAIDDNSKPKRSRTTLELLNIFENWNMFISTFDVLKDELDYFGINQFSEKDLNIFTKNFLPKLLK